MSIFKNSLKEYIMITNKIKKYKMHEERYDQRDNQNHNLNDNRGR